MFSMDSPKEHLIRNVRECIVVLLIIGVTIVQIFGLSSGNHIIEWCFVGIGTSVLIWVCVDIIRSIVGMRAERGYALPFVNTDAYE